MSRRPSTDLIQSGRARPNYSRLLSSCMAAITTIVASGAALAAPSCPIESAAIEAAKPNKLYLYFPTADVSPYPPSGCTIGTSGCFADGGNVTPVHAFDVANLPSYTGTLADLRNRITDVVTDDYCEFNVKVIQTTTTPPTTFARRLTVALGTDESGAGLYGEAQEVDTGDAIGADFARVWALTYQTQSGGAGGALNGANSTLERWAFSIGGTAAHEAGHTYGLTHANGAVVLPGEDPLGTHIMPAGPTVTPENRACCRRHFDDTSFSILAANVGLSIETIHNWDFTNPNSVNANRVRFDLLSTLSALTISWSYGGNLSPWSAPVVSGPLGTTTFRGTVYNRFQVTWSTGQAWANGAAGIVPAGANFHVGAAFAGVDYTAPDPVIVVKVALLDGSGNPLTLQPRMIGYDAGTLDAADGALRVNLFNTDDAARALIVRNVRLFQLPRVASIDSMMPGARPVSWQGFPITPWKSKGAGACDGDNARSTAAAGCTVRLGEAPQRITVSRLSQGRHIAERYSGKCAPTRRGQGPGDSIASPDVNECPNRGFSLDLFPSTMVYLMADVIDPAAKHWDPATHAFVVGPVTSKLFYQIAGRHPDLNRNGVDDYIDIATGTSKDKDRSGVPAEVKACREPLAILERDELAAANARLLGGATAKGGQPREETMKRWALVVARDLAAFRACEVKNGMQRPRQYAEK